MDLKSGAAQKVEKPTTRASNVGQRVIFEPILPSTIYGKICKHRCTKSHETTMKIDGNNIKESMDQIVDWKTLNRKNNVFYQKGVITETVISMQ